MINSLQKLSNWLLGSNFDCESFIINELIKSAGIKEDLIAKYPQFEAELTTSSNVVKPGYLKWVAQQLVRNEPVDEIINTINEFEKFKARLEQKDLYKYQTLGELRGAIEAGGQSNSQKKKDVKQNLDGTYDVLYNDDDYLVVHPHSKEASCYFGQGTKWCVSAAVSENYFNQYASDNIFLYFILSKKIREGQQDMSKIAYAYAKALSSSASEIFDAEDQRIFNDDVEHYLNDKYLIITNKIKEHLANTQSTKVYDSHHNVTIEKYNAQISELTTQHDKLAYMDKVSAVAKDDLVINRVFKDIIEMFKDINRTSYDWYQAHSIMARILIGYDLRPDSIIYMINTFSDNKMDIVSRDLEAIMNNSGCTSEVIDSIIERADEKIQLASEKDNEGYLEDAVERAKKVYYNAAINPRTSTDSLIKIYNYLSNNLLTEYHTEHSLNYIRELVLHNPSVPKEILETIDPRTLISLYNYMPRNAALPTNALHFIANKYPDKEAVYKFLVSKLHAKGIKPEDEKYMVDFIINYIMENKDKPNLVDRLKESYYILKAYPDEIMKIVYGVKVDVMVLGYLFMMLTKEHLIQIKENHPRNAIRGAAEDYLTYLPNSF